MPLPADVQRLLAKALKIQGSAVPFHRVLDILATEDGDVSEVINRYRDIQAKELRRTIHQCAELLRLLEHDAGLKPAWEPDTPAARQKAPAATADAPASPKPAAAAKPGKFTPDQLRPFENDDLRGKLRSAKLYIDGASKGNPGPAGIGYALITTEGDVAAQGTESIGVATNNAAEYTALLRGLEMAQRMQVAILHIISDSELLVRQMTGVYKIKDPAILEKAHAARHLARAFERVGYNHVPREQNKLADALSTASIPKSGSSGTD